VLGLTSSPRLWPSGVVACLPPWPKAERSLPGRPSRGRKQARVGQRGGGERTGDGADIEAGRGGGERTDGIEGTHRERWGGRVLTEAAWHQWSDGGGLRRCYRAESGGRWGRWWALAIPTAPERRKGVRHSEEYTEEARARCSPKLVGPRRWRLQIRSRCPSWYVVNASFIVCCAPSFVNLGTRFLLSERVITPRVMALLITFIEVLIKHEIRW
jgi:hypothetical protein